LRISPAHAALLKGTKSTADVALDPYHAVFLVRGQSPMVTTINDEALHALIARPYESGRIVTIVCHGTCDGGVRKATIRLTP
jgi:putative intracellular protease/amidase